MNYNIYYYIENAINNAIKGGISPEKAKKMAKFAEFLLEENEKYNLTAIKDPEKLAVLHFADSLTISEYIPENATVADIGAGAGFPSLPLAIYRDDIRVTAIDATEKKVTFIQEVAFMTALENINAIKGRAEEIFDTRKPKRETFDVVTARAVADLGILAELCAPAVKVGGKFIAMKGDNVDEELEGFEKASSSLGLKLSSRSELTLKGCGEEFRRNILIFEKVSPTLSRYPRIFGAIKKKPLF